MVSDGRGQEEGVSPTPTAPAPIPYRPGGNYYCHSCLRTTRHLLIRYPSGRCRIYCGICSRPKDFRTVQTAYTCPHGN